MRGGREEEGVRGGGDEGGEGYGGVQVRCEERDEWVKHAENAGECEMGGGKGFGCERLWWLCWR